MIVRPRWDKETLYSHATRIDPKPQRNHQGVLVRCPVHDDRNPSLSLWLDGGGGVHIHCWGGCGFKHVHDVLVRSYGFPAMVESFKGAEAGTPPPPPIRTAGKGNERVLWAGATRPGDNDPLTLRHRDLGTPNGIFTYTSEIPGRHYGYAARYGEGADRQWRMWTWWYRWDERAGRHRPRLRVKHAPSPRPLYGLERLARDREGTVWLVEGERTAQAIQRRLAPEAVAMTWMGGTSGIRYAEWSSLGNRRVVIIPDGDEEGRRCADELRNRLLTREAAPNSVDIVDVAKDLPQVAGEPWPRCKGWDLADLAQLDGGPQALRDWMEEDMWGSKLKKDDGSALPQWRRKRAEDEEGKG